MGVNINLRRILAIVTVSTILSNTAETKPTVDDKIPLKGNGNYIKINILKDGNHIVFLFKIYENLVLIIFFFRRGQTIFEERFRCAARFEPRHLLPRQCYYM